MLRLTSLSVEPEKDTILEADYIEESATIVCKHYDQISLIAPVPKIAAHEFRQVARSLL